ncbi:MAG: energy transducer TonB [Acidiferrobacteraceae bacterium]
MKPFYLALIPLLLAGCAVVNNGSSGRARPSERAREAWTYNQQINKIVGHSLRNVRVAEEHQAMKKAGHPVALATGWCSAAISINADGSVKQINITQCASHGLEKAERQAIENAAPFPPFNVSFMAVVHTFAPVATPGVNGN